MSDDLELPIAPPLQAWPTDDAAELYRWPERSWMRAMYLMSLEGAATGSTGRSRELSSDADRRLMGVARQGADAVLIGAQTMRAEHYSPMRAPQGIGTAPRLVVVSPSMDLPWDLPVWSESDHQPLVIGLAGVTPAARADQAAQHAEVLLAPEGTDLGRFVRPALRSLGLERIVCEGGPRLLSAIIGAGDLDEVNLTLAPLLLGGGKSTVGPSIGGLSRFALQSIATWEDFLFLRYWKATP